MTAIAGFDVPGVRPKPAPDLWLHVAREAGIAQDDFDRVLVFEDAVPGVLGAREAGMVPVGIGTKRESLIAAGVIDVFGDLGEWLAKQRLIM